MSRPAPARPPSAIYACGHVYACYAGTAHPPGRHERRCPSCEWRDEQRARGRSATGAPQGAHEAARAALGERT